MQWSYKSSGKYRKEKLVNPPPPPLPQNPDFSNERNRKMAILGLKPEHIIQFLNLIRFSYIAWGKNKPEIETITEYRIKLFFKKNSIFYVRKGSERAPSNYKIHGCPK